MNTPIVRYYSEKSGWHFAVLLRKGRKWAIVQHPVKGKKRVAVADLDQKEWAA